MKTLFRAVSLCFALALAGFATASRAVPFGTCTYWCQNDTTGQRAIVRTGSTQGDCCAGNVSCPPGSTYSSTLYWTGTVSLRC